MPIHLFFGLVDGAPFLGGGTSWDPGNEDLSRDHPCERSVGSWGCSGSGRMLQGDHQKQRFGENHGQFRSVRLYKS